MQAIISLSNLVLNYGSTAEAEIRSGLRASTILLAGALFISAAIPEMSKVEMAPIIDDSHQDIDFATIVGRFRDNLPAAKKGEAYSLAKLLLQLSERHQVSPGLLLSVIETESSFRAGVVSNAGAVGLMQMLPATAKEMATRYHISAYKTQEDLFNPRTNMMLGVAYIAYLRGRFGNSYHYLAAYNIGPTALNKRITAGNYELGAIEKYVTKIQTRTLKLRESSKSRSPASAIPKAMDREHKLEMTTI
jgi:hypothetical protein